MRHTRSRCKYDHYEHVRADVILPSPRSWYCSKSHQTGLCSRCNGLFCIYIYIYILYKMRIFCVTVHNKDCVLCVIVLFFPHLPCPHVSSHVWPQFCVLSGQSHRGVILHVWPLLEPRIQDPEIYTMATWA